MPWYEYEGQCPNGTAIAGRIEAEDHEAAREMLSETMHLRLRDVRQAKSPPPPAAISDDDFVFFNEQLASLASAGIALDQGLLQLSRDVRSRRLKRFIDKVVADLRNGEPLEDAIAKHESRLPVLYSRVIRAGVQSGQLPATLLGLNQHLRLMGQTRQVLWETLSYPIFLMVIALLIISFFFLQLVPQFREIFSDFGTRLPGPTLLLLHLADVYPTLLVFTAAVIGGAFVIWQLLRTTHGGRVAREVVVTKLPVVGNVYKASLTSRFVRSAATSIQAGIALPEALRLAGGVTGSPGLQAESERVASAVEDGRPIFEAAQFCLFIPAIFGYTVQLALGRNVLPSALLQLAETYEARASHHQAQLRLILFPAVVAGVGCFIAFAVLGLFLPLVTLINCVSG